MYARLQHDHAGDMIDNTTMQKKLESVATISEDAVIANDIAQKIEQPEEETAIGRLAGTLGGISIDLADVLSRLNDLKSQTKV